MHKAKKQKIRLAMVGREEVVLEWKRARDYEKPEVPVGSARTSLGAVRRSLQRRLHLPHLLPLDLPLATEMIRLPAPILSPENGRKKALQKVKPNSWASPFVL